MQKEDQKGLTVKKEQDFSEWYTQLLQKAELIEYSDVSGCYILRPRSYSVWEKIQLFLDTKFKSVGVQNSYFPLFIPESLLKKESEHFEGFTPEVAWVTKTGDSKLNEALAIRPTSETIMYTAYSKWVRSYKDLPLKLNQWCSVVRWEFKHPVPFLRSREFLWQEGHSVFSNEKEVEENTLEMLNFYAEAYEYLLAIPVIKGRKSDKEKFAGADYTLTVETLLPNGKAVQGATSHNLGQNFSKAFNIKYLSDKEKFEFAYQNSWGFSTRSIGVMLMMHSDDKGLVLPPYVAENKLVIVPILFDKTKAEVMKSANEINDLLKEFNPILDDRAEYTPGWKYNEWELKGIPIRIEIGPRDLDKGEVTAVTRHNFMKQAIKIKDLKKEITNLLDNMQKDLYIKSKEFLNFHIKETKDYKEFENLVNKNNIVKINWCNTTRCEENIKAKFEGVKSLAIDLKEVPLHGEKCICKEEAKVVCYFGKSY